MPSDPSDNRLLPLLAPRYWLLWLLFTILYLITRLPLAWQQSIGRLLGRVLFHTGPYRRHIAAVNIRLCFPEMSAAEQLSLLKKHYMLYGTSLIETFASWWGDPDLFESSTRCEGLDNLVSALQKGKGVILLSGHFTTLEVALPFLARWYPIDMMYRSHRNALFQRIMKNGRERYQPASIDRRDIRAIIRSLKSKRGVWYGPDQDYGRKHSVFVPFMGVMAATVTGTSRLAKMTGAAVVPYVIRRTEEGGYHLEVFPEFKDFPTDDQVQDARRINDWLEQEIRLQPENYHWTHRRFKTRPDGEQRPY